MRIIVEGPDGAGKTTLIEEIMAMEFEMELIRNNLEDKQDLEKWWPEVLDTEFRGVVPIHDRFFFSELVYGPVIRGRINPNRDTLAEVYESLKNDSLIIYCRPLLTHKIIDNVKSGRTTHMVGVTEKIEDLIEEYDSLMNRVAPEFGRRFYKYDYTDPGEPAAVTEAVRSYLSGDLT